MLKNKKLIIAAVAVIIILVAGVGFMAVSKDDTTSTQSSNNNNPQSSSSTTKGSLSSLATGKKAQECTMSYSGANGTGTGTMYSDGNGRARMHIDLKTEKGNVGGNYEMETKIAGVFAAGECTGGILQVSKAVYEGSMAGINAGKYVRQRKKAAD